ncbi:MAG TPA: MBL fold metallo-hydrolase [Candidatus Eisenbacteria bacterium]|nr:MBL fold metallo-hydrolase [Candidatus Eisenbacteria bacterium]
MRLYSSYLYLFLAFGAVVASAALAQDFDKVTIEDTDLGGGIHMLTGQGGNLGLSVGTDGVFLIDDQYAPLSEKIAAAIKKLTPEPVQFIINTHWHGDHTGGNENFGKAGAIIVAHDNVRVRMSNEQFNKAFDRKTPPSPAGALPVVTFAEGVTFHWNGEEMSVFHVQNAHTDGDAVIHFKNANVVHTGDVFFNGRYPFIDVDSGGSVKGVIAAADRILGMIDERTKVIPGHGPLGDKKALQTYRDMLADVSGKVESMLASGKTAEEIKASKPGQAYDASWGTGWMKPDTFLDVVIRDLSRKK